MAITFGCPHCHKVYRLGDRYAGRAGTCQACGTRMEVPAVPAGPPPEVGRSAGGASTYRYAAPPDPPPVVTGATPFLDQIARHVDRTVGPAPFVFHELVSPSVHVDLHVVPPTGRPPSADHPFGTSHYTVVTSGTSTRPMNVPRGAAGAPQYVELMVALPAGWPGLRPDGTVDADVMRDERHWWPFRWLKQVARLPATLNTFVGPWHTVPNGEAADPFAHGTGLGCLLLTPPRLSPRSAELVVNDHVTIRFLALTPIHPGEMRLKLDHGTKALADRLDAAGVTELIRPDRPDVSAG